MPKFPNMLYVKEIRRDKSKWLQASVRLEDHAEMDKTHEIGIYKFVKKAKVRGWGVVMK